ncbi:CgeB family protein [Blastococcus sp. VKM Ac-2987]|uniref:CgeB family protein n=1 Tax=Blastococcus sp. VKM Ac-2987 TaxID=3004141 RepID=UPI0022AB88A4|nr:glycosyltransferase [Blastococcus sp. VKM Ac-2987]MCZ2858500.1 glycosyltransferase [Blastococcus sp. VKM Ac-2987]
MKVLFVGNDWVGSNARSLADGFRAAGHDVVVVDSTRVTLPARLSPPWVYSKITGERAPWDVEVVHRRIERAAAALRPDLLLAFNAAHLDQPRLLGVRAGLHVHYSPDDVSNPVNTSPAYLEHERAWDLVVTTKRHNVPELLGRGVRAATFVLSAYDPAWHRPVARRDPRQYLVGFIGACRPDRRVSTTALARRYGAEMLVRGPGWRRVPQLHRTGATVGGPVYGEHFSAVVAQVTANLVLLNSDNRDTHTCRTFEVPAAGGLFVGERTDEHESLLEDGAECFLFSGADELHDILRRCEQDPDGARTVAALGHRRITGGGHTYADRAREIVSALR